MKINQEKIKIKTLIKNSMRKQIQKIKIKMKVMMIVVITLAIQQIRQMK